MKNIHQLYSIKHKTQSKLGFQTVSDQILKNAVKKFMAPFDYLDNTSGLKISKTKSETLANISPINGHCL